MLICMLLCLMLFPAVDAQCINGQCRLQNASLTQQFDSGDVIRIEPANQSDRVQPAAHISPPAVIQQVSQPHVEGSIRIISETPVLHPVPDPRFTPVYVQPVPVCHGPCFRPAPVPGIYRRTFGVQFHSQRVFYPF